MARIGTDKISWNNAFLLNFINFDFLQFFMSKTAWFFGVEISLDFVFGNDIFGSVFLGTDASSDIVWLRSLFTYLGRKLVSNVFW